MCSGALKENWDINRFSIANKKAAFNSAMKHYSVKRAPTEIYLNTICGLIIISGWTSVVSQLFVSADK